MFTLINTLRWYPHSYHVTGITKVRNKVPSCRTCIVMSEFCFTEWPYEVKCSEQPEYTFIMS